MKNYSDYSTSDGLCLFGGCPEDCSENCSNCELPKQYAEEERKANSDGENE